MTIATSYEQVTYNSPDGAQIGQGASEKVGFYGKVPSAQRGYSSAVHATSAASCRRPSAPRNWPSCKN
jgi:hypothetical protein